MVTAGFVVLPLLVAAGFVLAVEWAGRHLGDGAAQRRRRMLPVSAAVAAWLTITALVAASGMLRRFDATPPPFVLLLLAIVAIGIAVSFSSLGTLLVRGLPLWALVGSQVFRFPLELLMHRAYVEGLMPIQMSYSGRNFDILTGITAGVLGLWLLRGGVPDGVVALWTVFGFALLVNIVTVAIVSTPVFRWFGDDRLNTFVADAPFVWLPAVLVLAALIGHLLVWRKLDPWQLGRKTGFRSNEEFLQTVRDLVVRLETGGHQRAAAELNEGFRCLNGLTDGAALFLESIEKVEAADAARFAPEDRAVFRMIHKAVSLIVHRP